MTTNTNAALRMARAFIKWSAFGECRADGWEGPPPTAAEAVAAIESVLTAPAPSAQAAQSVGRDAAAKAVAWARPVYARPVNAPEPAEEWDEVVDIEFHNRPEKPEGEGWRPLVLADTGDGA